MPTLRLLVIGATGYIGGSILTTLQRSKISSIHNLELSAIVRREEQAKIISDNGIHPILFNSLDDTEILTKAASEHDIVINTASAFHAGAAKALIIGLGQRKKATGRDVYLFHTSGTSVIGDKPITKSYYEPRILSDNDDLYTYLKDRDAIESYDARTADLDIIDTGLEHDIKTYIIIPPTIYGNGLGLFNRKSIQSPTLIRQAIKRGRVDIIAPGNGVWDAVHIDDLATLYELLLSKILAGDNIPSGKTGIYFSETGDYTWNELAQGLAAELYKQGVLKTVEVNAISLEEFKNVYFGGDTQSAELLYASNSRSRAELGRELGWKPVKTRGDFKKSFKEEVEGIVAEGIEGLRL